MSARRTGRTTRMLQEAVEAARVSDSPIVVVGANRREVTRLQYEFAMIFGGKPPAHVRFASVDESQRGRPKNQRVFVDHYAKGII